MNELLKQFEREFEKAKKELKFKATLKELDDIFYLKDFIMKENYVSDRVTRQIARRIMEVYISWAQYLHGIIMINPGSLINVVESQAFGEEEKEEMGKIFDRLMAITAENNIIGITKNKEKERTFIDGSLALWREISPKLKDIMNMVYDKWNERAKAKPAKKEKKIDTMYG